MLMESVQGLKSLGMLKNVTQILAEGAGLDLTPEETLPPMDNIETVEDTVNLFSSLLSWLKNYALGVLLPLGIRLAIAVVIFLVGRYLVKRVVDFLDRSMHKNNVEEGNINFLCSLARGGGYVLIVMAVAYYLDFGVGAIVAVLGSAGLAIGLALQDSLSNFAAGILLLVSKPFRVGDYIIALGNEGVVVKMDLVYTTLLTADNRSISIPNGSLSNANIVNVTNEPKRRVDLRIGVDYDSDISKVKKVLEDLVEREELVLKEEDIMIFVDSFDASAITIGLRVWTKTEDYWAVKWRLQEQIKLVFDQNHISIPFDRVDVNMIKQ